MASGSGGQVGIEQIVKIQVAKGNVEVRWITIAHGHCATKLEIGLLELGMRLDLQLAATRQGIDEEVSGPLLVECKISEMDVGFKRRLFQGAVGISGEIHLSIDGKPGGFESRKAGQIQIASGQAHAELPALKSNHNITRNRRPINTGLDFGELDLCLIEGDSTSQKWDRRLIYLGIVDLESSLAMRMKPRTRGAQRKIRNTAYRILRPRHAGSFCQIGASNLQLESQGRSGLFDAVNKRKAAIETSDRPAMDQDSVVSRDAAPGILDSDGQRVPMQSLLRTWRSHRNIRIKIVGFEIPVPSEGGQSAAGGALEFPPSVNRKGQMLRSIGGLEERFPFVQIMAVKRNPERGGGRQTATALNF